MQHLPADIVGHILSRLECPRDVFVASTTCRTWQEAYRTHLLKLSFHYYDSLIYPILLTSHIETLVSSMIFRTTGLQELKISMPYFHAFEASTVISWLLYTQKTLRRLFFNVITSSWVNVLDYFCGFQRLEVLDVANHTIVAVRLNFHRFSCLKSLCLSYITILASDLGRLLSACPVIETFELVRPSIAILDDEERVELQSPTLKTAFFVSVRVERFIVKADSIESLHLKGCTFSLFELEGKGRLKHLKIQTVSIKHLDFGETTVDTLEILDVDEFKVDWPSFHEKISRSSKLRKLRLWIIHVEKENEWIDFRNIAAYFSQLEHLSLSYDDEFSEYEDRLLKYNFKDLPILKNVVVLELRWDDMHTSFWGWAEKLLTRCPNVRKLIINGIAPDDDSRLSDFNSLMFKFETKYIHLDVCFEYR